METDNNILDNLELRSESINEVFSQPPNKLVIWGNAFILIILFLILIFSYFVKIPEYVNSNIIIESNNYIWSGESPRDGKVDKILVRDSQYVKKNQIILILKSDFDSLPQSNLNKVNNKNEIHHVVQDKNIIKSAYEGNIYFLKPIRNIYEVTKDDKIFYVISQKKEDHIFGTISLKSSEVGKVTLGQKVVIKLEKYPHEVYGTIEGKVEMISKFPNSKDLFYVSVSFPTSDLQTSFHKKVNVNLNLRGIAQIEVSKDRLIDKIFKY